jgi:5'-3' exonuclease
VAIADLLEAAGITRLGFDGYEADDVIGSLAAQAAGPLIAVSGDRDLVQIVDDRCSLLLTVNGGMDRWPLLDRAGVRDRFGVEPSHYVDLAVLRGDPSDGLPGVRGIGAKTAVGMVSAFGDIDGILAAAERQPDIRPMTPRLAESLLAHREVILRARTVARVVLDLPVADVPTRLPAAAADPERLSALAAGWGVARQISDLQAAMARQDSSSAAQYPDGRSRQTVLE